MGLSKGNLIFTYSRIYQTCVGWVKQDLLGIGKEDYIWRVLLSSLAKTEFNKSQFWIAKNRIRSYRGNFGR